MAPPAAGRAVRTIATDAWSWASALLLGGVGTWQVVAERFHRLPLRLRWLMAESGGEPGQLVEHHAVDVPRAIGKRTHDRDAHHGLGSLQVGSSGSTSATDAVPYAWNATLFTCRGQRKASAPNRPVRTGGAEGAVRPRWRRPRGGRRRPRSGCCRGQGFDFTHAAEAEVVVGEYLGHSTVSFVVGFLLHRGPVPEQPGLQGGQGDGVDRLVGRGHGGGGLQRLAGLDGVGGDVGRSSRTGADRDVAGLDQRAGDGLERLDGVDAAGLELVGQVGVGASTPPMSARLTQFCLAQYSTAAWMTPLRVGVPSVLPP